MKCVDGKGVRRNHEAEGWLVTPDGERVPGSGMCRKHARRCMAEYSEKLDELWTFDAKAVCCRCGSPAVEDVDHVWRHTPIYGWGFAEDGSPAPVEFGLSEVLDGGDETLDYPYFCNGCDNEIEEVVWEAQYDPAMPYVTKDEADYQRARASGWED